MHDDCYGCKNRQVQDVTFRARHPITFVTYEIEYCSALGELLTKDTKNAAFQLGCNQKDKV